MQSIAAHCSLNTAEYFINNDPGEGSGTALEAKDGAFDSLYEEVSLTGVDISGLPVGDHRIGIRFKDKSGNWSVVQYRGFRVQSGDVELEPEVVSGGQSIGNYLVAAEYFINGDPGEGSGTALEAKDGAFDSLYEEVNTDLPVANLKGGIHRVGIRFKDNKGVWSLPSINYFRIYDFGAPDDTEPPTIKLVGEKNITIKKGEVFNDPGATAEDEVDGDLTENISVLSSLDTNIPGEYVLTYSVTDLSGNISEKITRNVIVIGKSIPNLVWDKPSSITYGKLLLEEELDAKAEVPGAYVYSPQGGALLNAGEHTLKVTFIPDNLDQYEVVKSETTLVVKKAPLIIRAKDASRKNGETNPAFELTYEGFIKGEDKTVLLKLPIINTPATDNSAVGEYAIVVSGAEAQNYSIIHVNGTLKVLEGVPTFTWQTPDPITYGTLLGDDQLRAESTINGIIAYSPFAGNY